MRHAQGRSRRLTALLHEGGHTEHFAHTSPSLPFEYRHLGDNSVTEGFAFIFDHLLLNPRWLEALPRLHRLGRVPHAGQRHRALLHAPLRRQARLRDRAARRRRVRSAPWPQGYSDKLSDAVQVEVPPANYLVDVDDGFYAASYLRAWMLEGALPHDAAGPLQHGVVLQPQCRRLPPAALVARAELHRRPAAAQERRRAARRASRSSTTSSGRWAARGAAGAGGPGRAAPARSCTSSAAAARAVELGEEHALPGAQLQGGRAAHRHGHAAAHQAGPSRGRRSYPRRA